MLNSTDCYAILLIIRYGRGEELKSCIKLILIIKNRGKIMERNGQKYFLTIHPAAAIYNKNLRSVLNNDLFLLSKEIKKMEYDNKRTSLLDYMVDETKL